jgi:hypothetical protein
MISSFSVYVVLLAHIENTLTLYRYMLYDVCLDFDLAGQVQDRRKSASTILLTCALISSSTAASFAMSLLC